MLSNPVTVTVDIRLTPEQLAEAFWQMDGDAQAHFFIQLGHLSDDGAPNALGSQMCYMVEALRNHADRRGIETVQTLADFAYKFGRLNEPADKWML